MVWFVLIAAITGMSAVGLALYRTRQSTDDSERYRFVGACAFAVIISDLLMIGIAASIIQSRVYYKEFINYKVVSMTHEEEWTTRETRTVQEYVGTDSKGNSKYRTKIEHYTQHHGPYWTAYTDIGREMRISDTMYTKWCMVWKTEQKTGVHNGSSAGFFDCKSGDIYEAKWPQTFDTIFPMWHIGTYKNKPRASNTVVMNGFDVSEELSKKYKRPADMANHDGVINYGANITVTPEDLLMLERMNATLGKSKQVHCMLLTFDAKKDSMAVVNDVFWAWNGVNKNELVIFIGIDPDTKKCVWIRSESWLDRPAIHNLITTAFLNQPFNVSEMEPVLAKLIEQHWVRKHFSDFDYITIDPSDSDVITFFGFMLLVWITQLVLIEFGYRKHFPKKQEDSDTHD